MALLSLDELSIGYRGPALLDGVSAQIEPGQRIGLLGRNGAGKTTLLKILCGEVVPDHGSVRLSSGAKVARLVQDVPRDVVGTIRDVTLAGQLETHADGTIDESKIDHSDLWRVEHAVDSTLSRMFLDPDTLFESLSSGMKRRVLLARAIASEPDLLLLDEPTNHLDVPSILWLEDFLSRWNKTLMFITHDRSFLQRLATRIWEVDRGRLFDWSCDYQTFLVRKEATLAAEEKQNALFDKKLAEEEVWIRQGIKARRTRNEGRVRALKALREQRGERRNAEGKAKLNVQAAERSGALVAKVKNICFGYDDKEIINDFTTTVMRGDKIGIIGPNGAGKTTILKLLLGQLEPQSGSVKLGTNLEIAYFDQLRDTLDPEQTVTEAVGEGSDRIVVGGATKHIVGYLQDFLFTAERARTQVKYLSGGERNRALLAKLMTKPANIFVLDEPTNDLDTETLELLELQLVNFPGTLLVVSHDRTFLNNVVTSTIVFEEDGVNEYVGGYAEWQDAVKRRGETEVVTTDRKKGSKPLEPTKLPAAKKLGFNEQQELKRLPGQIEKMEAEIAALHETMADPDFYQKPAAQITAATTKLAKLDEDLASAFTRWESLEGS